VSLRLPVVWSDKQSLHVPGGEIFVGVRTPGTEVPERADCIRRVLEEAGAPVVAAHEHGVDAVLAVHDPEFVAFMSTAWDDWAASDLVRDPGQDRVVPYVFALSQLTSGRPPHEPVAVWARPGRWAMDTMTLIGPGTWGAAVGAVEAAVTAAELVVDGAPAAYAVCRPPGHHAAPALYGGSCYLNNASCAAQHLAATGRRVGIVDIDAHHGNGTQEIFYERADVLFTSVHVDPGAGWFPHFLGFADETGAGRGEGANRNLPVAPGTGDDGWLDAVVEAVRTVAAFGADAVVVSLGVDAAAGDPESPLQVSAGGYRAAGALVGSLGLPTVVVQEGGYDLATIGELVAATLSGLEEGQVEAS
jgi:acetoin utilization deacetylase AcuC-like enzyme